MNIYENPRFSELPPEIYPLFAAAAKESFFSHPSWYDLLQRHALPQGAQVRLYTEDPERSGAALVCYVEKPGRVHDLRSLCNAYSCEHDAILASHEEGSLENLQTLATTLGGSEGWETVVIPGLDATAPSFRALGTGLRRAGLVVKPFFDSGTWFEPTAGLSFEDYMRGRPSILRNTWRRKRKQLEAAGALEVRFAEGGGELDEAIAAYESVYRRSWKPAEMFPAFIPALIALLSRLGALRLGIVYLDGEPIAAEFWIIWHGRAVIYKLAYDQRLHRHSPGTYLTMRMMERVLARDRPDEVNFGRGDDPYKKLWLSRRRERWGILAANPRTARGVYASGRILASRWLRRLRGDAIPSLVR